MTINTRLMTRSFLGGVRFPLGAKSPLTQPAYIAGTVQVEGTPVKRRVRCYDRYDGRLVGEVWSDEQGQYRIDYLRLGHPHLIVALDYHLEYNAVVADNVLPVAGLPAAPTELGSSLLAPADFTYSYDNGTGTNTVYWKNLSVFQDEVRVYRSTSPMDPNNLPAPLTTLGPYDQQYDDTTVLASTVYYYRVSTVRDGVEVVSEELETISLGDEPNYQYWRLYITNTPSGTYIQISEFELLSTEKQDLTDPTGASASDYVNSSYTPDKTMDDTTSSFWYTATGFPQWLMFSASEEIKVSHYTITPTSTVNYAPQDFELQGSVDGTDWVTLDTQTGITFTSYEKKTFSLA